MADWSTDNVIMTFEEHIRRNKQFSLLLIFIVAAIVVLLGYVFGAAFWGSPFAGWVGVIIAGIISVIWSLTAFYNGAKMVLAVAGAKRVDKRYNARLWNVTEEMAIAAGTPVPKLHIINSSVPNAFAAGRDPRHAAIAVTTGLLENLSRDELQGVIGHEMAHIANYDIRFQVLVGVLVGMIALICDFAVRYIWWGGAFRRRGSSGGANAHPAIVIIALILMLLAPVFAQIIRLAISRRREFLADATSAKLTRYPEGLASALEKIAGDRGKLAGANRATNHLYIINPVHKLRWGRSSLFSTHPPTEERIRRLRSM